MSRCVRVRPRLHAGPMLSDGSVFMQYLLDVLKDGLPTADVIYPQADGAEVRVMREGVSRT